MKKTPLTRKTPLARRPNARISHQLPLKQGYKTSGANPTLKKIIRPLLSVLEGCASTEIIKAKFAEVPGTGGV